MSVSLRGFASNVSSACESRRKRKAWGVSPRCLRLRYAARENGRQLSNSLCSLQLRVFLKEHHAAARTRRSFLSARLARHSLSNRNDQTQIAQLESGEPHRATTSRRLPALAHSLVAHLN